MQWIAPIERKDDAETLEDRLWKAADQLRANSGLTSAQYSQPVLGLIFLRFAEVRFLSRLAALEKLAAGGRRGSRVDDPAAYHPSKPAASPPSVRRSGSDCRTCASARRSSAARSPGSRRTPFQPPRISGAGSFRVCWSGRRSSPSCSGAWDTVREKCWASSVLLDDQHAEPRRVLQEKIARNLLTCNDLYMI